MANSVIMIACTDARLFWLQQEAQKHAGVTPETIQIPGGAFGLGTFDATAQPGMELLRQTIETIGIEDQRYQLILASHHDCEVARRLDITDEPTSIRAVHDDAFRVIMQFFSPISLRVGHMHTENEPGKPMDLWSTETGNRLPRFDVSEPYADHLAPGEVADTANTSDDNH